MALLSLWSVKKNLLGHTEVAGRYIAIDTDVRSMLVMPAISVH
jgi:hypothetical protein